MDVIPAVILKLRYPKLKWIATWFQTAPNPLFGYTENSVSTIHRPQSTEHLREHSYNLSALAYWLSQLPIKPLINKYADFVIVNNESERNQYPKMDKKGRVVVLIGAVRLDEIKKYQAVHRTQTTVHQFDAVFQGRFHPQKGVLELIDIWKKVVDKIPNAKLAMMGDGPLMENVKTRITKHRLQNNVKLFGYMFDGPEKYKIFSQSKVVVHPAFFDSGGMASAEAMAFGLPCVGFDLKAYESYYPRGMVKVKKGNIDGFASEIINLITHDKLRRSIGEEGRRMIEANWSWETRAREVFKKII